LEPYRRGGRSIMGAEYYLLIVLGSAIVVWLQNL
jgi:hypothetical protein